MTRISLSLLLACAIVLNSYAQKTFSEIPVNPAPTPTVKCLLAGDSIFLSYEEASFVPKITMWIPGNGSQRSFDMGGAEDKVLAHIASRGNKEQYYFIERDKDVSVLTCLTHDTQTGTHKWEDGQLTFPGVLVGGFFSKDVHLISAKPNEKIIRILRIDGLNLEEEKRFTLQEPLLKQKRTTVAFIDAKTPVTPTEAQASVKIFRRESTLLICTDAPYDPVDETQSIYKTAIHKLNLKSGDYSFRYFVESSDEFFYSTIFNGHLYRLINARDSRLQIFDLETGMETASFHFSVFNSNPDIFAYIFDENNGHMGKAKFKRTVPHLNYIIPDTVSSETILRVGYRYGTHPTFPSLASFGLLPSLISIVTNIALLSTPATPEIDAYFYLKGSPETGFYFTEESGLLSQKVSAYELQLAEETKRYSYKNYLYGQGFAYGIYLERKSDKIQILKFSTESVEN